MSSDNFFVVGNGPSLTPRIIQALPEGSWLGMNSAFRYWNRIGKYPRYYACLDPVVLRSQLEGIVGLLDREEITDFFLHDCALQLYPALAANPKVTLLSEFLNRTDLRLLISRLGCEKQTTGALATRFVIEKGHDAILLIGVDCKYVEMIDGASAAQGMELVINSCLTSNPNYFFGDYQSVGDRYQVPNPMMHSGNLHLQSFVALRNDLDLRGLPVRVSVGSDRSLLSRFGVFLTRPIWSELGIRRIGAIAVPMTSREWRRQIQNLHLWMDPRFLPSMTTGSQGTCLHLFFSGAPDEELLAEVESGLADVSGLTSFFAECRITFLDIPPEIDHYRRSTVGTDDPSTKSGPNVFFLSTMAHCKEYEYVLHIETDCLPVRAGWLDAAEREIERAGTQAWVIGPAYFGPSSLHSAYRMHINGNAIYQTGDPDFQAFLQDTFLEILAQLLRSGFRDMAYDTALSVALQNIEALPESVRKNLYLALPRFAYSNFIRNAGGVKETADPSLLDLRVILEESDQTFMLHGRPSFTYLDGDRTYLPEIYRSIPGAPLESLPLFYVWTNDSGLQAELRGYGRVELKGNEEKSVACPMLTFHFARLRGPIAGRRWRMSMIVEGDFPSFSQATFAFSDKGGVVTQISAVVRRETGADATSSLFFECPQCPDFDSDNVSLYLQELNDRPATLLLRSIVMLEDNSKLSATPLSLKVCARAETSVKAIERWHRLYDSLPRCAGQFDQPQWIHWQSPYFLLTHVTLRATHLTLIAKAERLPGGEGGLQSPLLKGIFSGAPWQRASSFRVQVKSSDPNMNGDAVIRVCRNAHTPWEYLDLPLRLCAGLGESAPIKANFSHPHQAYRIELLTFPGADGVVSLQIDLEVELLGGGLNETFESAGTTLTLPRLLIFDMTAAGNGTATGEIKSNLLADWADGKFLQIAQNGHHGLSTVRRRGGQFVVNSLPPDNAMDVAREYIDAFDPDVVLYRPTPNTEALHRFAMDEIARLGKPLVTWIMDDWPAMMATEQPGAWALMKPDLIALLERSAQRLSICEAMSEAFLRRYGLPFQQLANGIDPANWGQAAKQEHEGFLLRYAGGLAPDMNRDSVLQVAAAVERLASLGTKIRFEICTQSWWFDQCKTLFEPFPSTHLELANKTPPEYRLWLAEADALLIAYNFDEKSMRYIRYSMANKMPECLASGAALLVYGPKEVATVAYLAEAEVAKVVDFPDIGGLTLALANLAESVETRLALGEAGRQLAFEMHDIRHLRSTLASLLTQAAGSAAQSSVQCPAISRTTAPSTIFTATGEEADRLVLLSCATALLKDPGTAYERLAMDKALANRVSDALLALSDDNPLKGHFKKIQARAESLVTARGL